MEKNKQEEEAERFLGMKLNMGAESGEQRRNLCCRFIHELKFTADPLGREGLSW